MNVAADSDSQIVREIATAMLARRERGWVMVDIVRAVSRAPRDILRLSNRAAREVSRGLHQ